MTKQIIKAPGPLVWLLWGFHLSIFGCWHEATISAWQVCWCFAHGFGENGGHCWASRVHLVFKFKCLWPENCSFNTPNRWDWNHTQWEPGYWSVDTRSSIGNFTSLMVSVKLCNRLFEEEMWENLVEKPGHWRTALGQLFFFAISQ